MTKQSSRTFFANTVAALFVTLSSSSALADRMPPEEVLPIVYEGVRYECPHWGYNNGCGQNGGCVVAYDDVTGEQLWELQVYCTHYRSDLEGDVQDVFITNLEVENGKLVVFNEKGLQFAIDPQTLTVTGNPRGCDHGGCNVRHVKSTPVTDIFLCLGSIALLWIGFRRRGPKSIPKPIDFFSGTSNSRDEV